MVLMQSDIPVGRTCAIAILPNQPSSATTQDKLRAVVAKVDRLWEAGSTVTYSFVQPAGTAKQQAKVHKVILEWLPYANVNFVFAEKDGKLRISFDPDTGSWSYLARDCELIAANQATVNFGWVADTTDITNDDRAVILHEFGHVLGLIHEHQSPARGATITLDIDAVYAWYGYSQGWDEKTIDEQIINTYNASDVSNYSQFDDESIMLYPMPAWMNEQNIEITMNYTLSDFDKAYMLINYPRVQALHSEPLWTLDHALEVVGVDISTTSAIRNAHGDAVQIRLLFTAFQIRMRRAAAPPKGHDVLPPAGGDPGQSIPSRGLNDITPDDIPDEWCLTDDPEDADDVSGPPGGVSHGVYEELRLWWPYQTITYGFIYQDQATEYRMSRVRNVFKFYERHTSLAFRETVDAWNLDPTRQMETCNIRIDFGAPGLIADFIEGRRNGYAEIGTDQLDRKDVPVLGDKSLRPLTSLWLGVQGWDSDHAVSWYQDYSNRILYHEIGHALGLRHEHIITNGELVENKLEATGGAIRGTKFDPESVMLYPGKRYKEFKLRYPLTVRNFYPSGTDLDLLALLYPDKLDQGTFARALETMQFTDAQSGELLKMAHNAFLPQHNRADFRAAVNRLRATTMQYLQHPPRLSSRRDVVKYNPTLPLPFPVLDLAPVDVPPRDVLPGGPPSRDVLPGGPPRDIMAPAAAPDVRAVGFLYELVDALKDFFNPGGNQMFTLQFPGRFLDQNAYAWDTSKAGPYGQFVKPTVVNEAEFRLVDQLYDATDVVVGPNGTNLSIVYNQLINNLLPKFVENGLAEQQDQIRQWLLKDVPITQWIKDIMARQKARELALAQKIAAGTRPLPTSAPSGGVQATPSQAAAPTASAAARPVFDIASKTTTNGETLNRIELSELLMSEYLYAKQDWELERDALILQANTADLGTPESQRALDALTRQLSHITATRQAQLASKYSDAVVRGYSHTIRQYMGYLDISSPAEALQDAKDSLREAAMSSLDGSMNIYPVQMTPLDWFAGLSTSFTLEDLTQDREVIRFQINVKSQELDVLNGQLVSLRLGSQGDPAALRSKVQAAQKALDTAQSDLAQAYSSNVIAMAKTFLTKDDKLGTKELAGELHLPEAVLQQLPAMLDTVQKAQNELTSSSRALTQLMAAQALAEATDTKQQQQQLQLQITGLSSDLAELQTRWKVLTAGTGGLRVLPTEDTKEPSPAPVPTTPIELPTENTSGGSRWQQINFESTVASRASTTAKHSEAQDSRWSCNLWFASASGSSTGMAAEVVSTAQASTDKIELAMRVTLVTVDRGGWFQPQFFAESNAFFKVNPNISWDGDHGLMPGFPIGFLIVKDAIIRVTHAQSNIVDIQQNDARSAATAGGFLCFSMANSSASNSSSTSSSFEQYSNGFVVKIPGPQILGYMIQKTGRDETELMPPKLPPGFFIPDDEYDRTVNGPAAPPHGIDGRDPGGPANGKAPAQAPTISKERLREALDGMLGDKIDQLFETMSRV
ncbi:hypothetical protein B0H11DRAFT_2105041 [Mycena galericulata]|nr:hypothetical protein B0H11DRAFT_2105041 [Mycena galericulata]